MCAHFEAQISDSDEVARVFRDDGGCLDVYTMTDAASVVFGRSLPERPIVGDWVVLDPQGTRVARVLERKTAIVRRAAGRATAAQALAANVDVVFIVTSMNLDFEPSRIERYLATVYAAGARPVVVLNKADLVDDTEPWMTRAEAASPGAEVVALSALDDEGPSPLLEFLGPGKTAALLGSSGVGKSTIVNRLLGSEVEATKEIRADDDEGRHTTTRRHLVVLADAAGVLIDTPGLRELQLWDAREGLDEAFRDIDALDRSCRFRNCGHVDEPGCAVIAAVEAGELSARRLRNYKKLLREAAHFEQRHDVARQRAESRKLGKMYKGVQRLKHEKR